MSGIEKVAIDAGTLAVLPGRRLLLHRAYIGFDEAYNIVVHVYGGIQ